MNYFIFSIVFLIILFCLGFVILKIIQRQNDYKRTLSLTFLKVTMPKKDSELDEKQETTRDFKEMVGIMEQLYASMKSIYSWKILKKILGQDILSFEYVAHENETYFYVVLPKTYKNLIEKQINWFYTDAII